MTLSRDPDALARDKAATLRAIHKALDPEWTPRQDAPDRVVSSLNPRECRWCFRPALEGLKECALHCAADDPRAVEV